jgi:Acyltransferase family
MGRWARRERPAHVSSDATGNKSQFTSLNFPADSGAPIEIVEPAASVGGQAAAPRLPGLDLPRAIAISLVMLFHASLLRLDSAQHWIVRFGWMGVDLFFVLSGFLIAGQLFRPFARGSKPNYPVSLPAACFGRSRRIWSS